MNFSALAAIENILKASLCDEVRGRRNAGEDTDDFYYEKEIDELVEEKKLLIREIFSYEYISDEVFDGIKQRLKSSWDLKKSVGVAIVDSEEFTSWYPSRKADLDNFYWNRFTKYLKREHADKFVNVNPIADDFDTPDAFTAIDRDSDKIMDLLGDPTQESFDRKGLILGDVQSGKTINFTAVMNKAADAGYKTFIILAGTIEGLRKQTQTRLEKEFVGATTIERRYIGVGTITEATENELRTPKVLTTSESDVTRTLLELRDVDLNEKRPTVIVIKKNTTVLQALKKWINRWQNQIIALRNPTLILDDEADYAGVNTSRDEENPTKINSLIREILTFFKRKTYVAITATPYANVFINPDTEDKMLKDDLFPRDFVYMLNTPSTYVGIERIFGENADRQDVIQEMTDLQSVLKDRHKQDAQFNRLPISLKKAIMYFFLVNAAIDKCGNILLHRSMLVHISHFRACHRRIACRIEEFVYKLRTAITNYAGLPPEEALCNSRMAELKSVWDEMKLEDILGYTWKNIQQNFLYKATVPIKVITVNSDPASKSLNYKEHESNGLRAIIVGGNSLSRGLTLEGLVVSYFRRTTQMYDTLTQMGRWFGYNLNLIPYAKVWMPESVKNYFSDIANAYTEFKEDIQYMYENKLPPKEFGIQVRRSSTSLLPTARNKMKNTRLCRNVNVLGGIVATPRLSWSNLDNNEKLIRNFVFELDELGKRDLSVQVPYWRGVSKIKVANLVKQFVSGEWNLSYRGKALSKYILKEYQSDDWDVVIVGRLVHEGRIHEFPLKSGNVATVNLVTRKATRGEDETVLISGSNAEVSSGATTAKIGLTQEQITLAERLHKERAEREQKAPKKNLSSRDFFVEEIKRKPVLYIYPIEITELEELKGKVCYAIGLGFPGNKFKGKPVEYHVNLVRWRELDAQLSEDSSFDDEEARNEI